jgi:predicted DsbA family dithiol-disulfide isomerase
MNVEIWSDVFCPFCYIGKRRFEEALARFPRRDDVTVVWRSFQLDPDAPVESPEVTQERLAKKFGNAERARAMTAHVAQLAAEVGLRYDFDRTPVTNSFDAHRLAHLAAARGLGDAAEERLFAAYFVEGRHVGRHDSLLALGGEIGLDRAEVAATLAGDAYADAVRADIAEAAALGISGVPFFIFDRTYGVSGAQPSDVFLDVLDTAWSERAPLTVPTPAGTADAAACAADACAVPAGAAPRRAERPGQRLAPTGARGGRADPPAPRACHER